MTERSIGNYQISEKLNTAGTIAVYKAFDPLIDSNVIIKASNRNFSGQSGAAEKLRLEAEVLAKLKHPCIPALHSLINAGDELFMILDFADGETLQEVLYRRGKLPCDEAGSIFVQLLGCLEIAHQTGFTHGKIKTSNIILTDTGIIKILGFGKSDYSSSKKSESNKVGASIDIYAAGAMLFEILTGEYSYAKTKFELKDKTIEEMLERLRSVQPAVPEAIISLIIKAVFPTPAKRFQTAAEFLDELKAIDFNASNVQIDEFNRENTEKAIYENNLKNSLASSYSINFSQSESELSESKPGSHQGLTDKADKAIPENSFVKENGKIRYKIAAATIFAVFIVQFVWQFSFIQSEKLRDIEKTLNNIQLEELPAKIITEEKPVEAETVFVEKKAEIVSPVKNIIPVVYRQPENKPVKPENKPPQAEIRKKPLREPQNDSRIRRAEKLLTGF